ncbi:MAG: universal stress protein [Candidatus Kariarchaeaceae archaeon]|jgi:nucleotide-binding universal stress UspA family protein
MYKKILIGIDKSDHSEKAIDKAIEIYNRDKSDIVLFHSVLHKMSDLTPIFGPNMGEIQTFNYELHRARVDEAKHLLEDVKDKFKKSNVPVETRLVYNVGPQYYIKDKVEEEGFDLVLLGCSGEHSKLRRTVLGTVPEYVLNHVSSDVLIVK